MTKKKVAIEIKEPCLSCPELENFSFDGCAASCQKLFQRARKLISPDKPSLCMDWRCGLPIAQEDRSLCSQVCRWAQAYSAVQGEGDDNIKSSLGRDVVRTRVNKKELFAWRNR